MITEDDDFILTAGDTMVCMSLTDESLLIFCLSGGRRFTLVADITEAGELCDWLTDRLNNVEGGDHDEHDRTTQS